MSGSAATLLYTVPVDVTVAVDVVWISVLIN